MKEYFELKIKINPEISEIISDICFENFQCEGVVLAEEEYKDDLVLVSTTEGTLKAYLKTDENIENILKEQRQILLSRGLSENDLGSWDFEISKIENQDWSKKWKENWEVTHVSEKLSVAPNWIEYQPQKDEIVIKLDPGSAFGTGTHPTTQLCMRAIEKYIKTDDEMADIGTGSGILAITATKLAAASAVGIDNDETVINTAIENADKNEVGYRCLFECKTADQLNDKFDLITANILHNILADIMGNLKALMKPNAILILSGILDEKKQVVLDSIKTHNLKLAEEMQQDIWTAFVVTN